MKYSVYDTGKTGKIYKSAREGVQEWSERPLKITWEAQITFFAARSKIWTCFLFLWGKGMPLIVRFVMEEANGQEFLFRSCVMKLYFMVAIRNLIVAPCVDVV